MRLQSLQVAYDTTSVLFVKEVSWRKAVSKDLFVWINSGQRIGSVTCNSGIFYNFWHKKSDQIIENVKESESSKFSF